MNATSRWIPVLMLAACLSGLKADVGDLVIESFGPNGQLTFSTLDDGTDYNYRIEWAPTASGPWNAFEAVGAFGQGTIQAEAGASVTVSVPMFYRVVATLGDYMVIDVSEGPDATSYPVTYYRTLADVPGGPNSDEYKTTKLILRRIPAGTFTMGSPNDEPDRDSDEAQRQVTLTKDYYMGVFQVTQRQWERVIGDWPSYFDNPDYRDSRPLETRSWNDIRGGVWPGEPAGSGQPAAGTFIERISARTGLTFDLPTEAQWEYAGRAGTTTALNSGKNLTNTDSCPNMHEMGRYRHNHPGGHSTSSSVSTDGGTAKVGSYLPNAWGLYDMHGNVWEWCLDWYEAYNAPTTDPVGAASGSYRVLRGGGGSNYASNCRSAYRNFLIPGARGGSGGFRLSRTLP